MSKLQEDNVWVGIGVSIFFSIFMFYVLVTLNQNLIGKPFNGREFGGIRERFIATLAVFFNIIPFIIYLRAKKDHSMRGVGIVTVLLALFVVVFYYL
ncbi:MAG: hypothetical protein IPG60_14180 [Bacteroidetes bacterium]|nr:hypothetical protein [Bacteroidota bacterium]MBP7400642.1 hypothetical protein [Chitinophagales bacterium]MBK7110225.1 hypothetical protein [Bacteroidota bacterium]MBK8680431.1 hypothetical protein [Bacteroidota bacterium]MBP9190609.1 hypothetical protein [Chitinophagales bacterium]